MRSNRPRAGLGAVAAAVVLGVAALLGASTAGAAAPGRSALSSAARAAPAVARPGPWSRPFPLSPSYTGDVLPAQIAFAPSGEATVAFGVYNIDFPWVSRALLSARSPAGRIFRPRRVPGVQEVLALDYDGAALELLTGASPTGFTCCSSVWTLTFTGGRFRNQHTLLTGLDGVAQGDLVALPRSGMLAEVATGEGTWVAQGRVVGRFGPPHRLTSLRVAPQSVAGAPLQGGRSAVAWTETAASYANVPATGIFLATGNANSEPRFGRRMLSVPSGHGIDELALAGGAAGATAAWTESWYDASGTYRAEAAVADLAGRVRARTFAVPGQLASGVTLAADARGDQVLAWKTCDPVGVCSVREVSRGAGRRFGAPQRLGAIDVGEDPAAAVSPNGEALVGWVSGGHVLTASARRAGARFGAPATISSIPGASAVTLAFGPAGQALAAWTQGAYKSSVFGAYRP